MDTSAAAQQRGYFRANVTTLRSLQHRMQLRAEASSSLLSRSTSPTAKATGMKDIFTRADERQHARGNSRQLSSSSPASSGATPQAEKAISGEPISLWSPLLHAAVLRIADVEEVDITAGSYRVASGTTRRTGSGQLPERSLPLGTAEENEEAERARQAAIVAAISEIGTAQRATCHCCAGSGRHLCCCGVGSKRKVAQHDQSRHHRRHRSRVSGGRHHRSRSSRKDCGAGGDELPQAKTTVGAASPSILPSALASLTPDPGAAPVVSPYRDQERLERIMAKYRTPPSPPKTPPMEAKPQQQPFQIVVHCGCGQVSVSGAENAPAALTNVKPCGLTTSAALTDLAARASTASAAAKPPIPSVPPLAAVVPPPPPAAVVPPPPPAAVAPPPPAPVVPPPPPAPVVPPPPAPVVPPPPPTTLVPTPLPRSSAPASAPSATSTSATAASGQQVLSPPQSSSAPAAGAPMDEEKRMLLEKADKYVLHLEQEVQHHSLHYNMMLQQLAEEEARSASLRHDRDALLALNGGLQASLDYTHVQGSGGVSRHRQAPSELSSSSSSSREATGTTRAGAASNAEKQPARRLPPAVQSVYASLQTPEETSVAASTSLPAPVPGASTPSPPTATPAATAAPAKETTSSATQEVLRHVLLEREAGLKMPAAAQAQEMATSANALPATMDGASGMSHARELQDYVDHLCREAEAGAAQLRHSNLSTTSATTPFAQPTFVVQPSYPSAQHTTSATFAQQQQLGQRQRELEQLRAEVAAEGERMQADTRRWRAYLQQQQRR